MKQQMDMKKIKKSFLIQDKLAGFKYVVIEQNKTHYLAIDSTGETVRINKTQAVRL